MASPCQITVDSPCPPASSILPNTVASAKISTNASRGNGMLTAQCIPCNFGPAPCPANVCTLSPLNRMVVAIVTLANADGSTASEILAEHNSLCPENTLTSTQVANYLANGKRRGVFATVGVDRDHYKVNLNYASLPSNVDLLREVGPRYHTCLGLIKCATPLTN